MRILHVVRTPVSVTAFLAPFLKMQSAQGHTVAVACNCAEDFSMIEELGITVHPYPFERTMRAVNICRAIRSLHQIIEKEKFELIIIHMQLAGGVGRLAAKFSKNHPKIVYVSHGLPCGPGQNKLRWLFWFSTEWLLGRITDAMFVMNDYDYRLARRTRMIARPDSICRIAGMGVNINKFFPHARSHNSAFWKQFGLTNMKTVVCVARLIKEKGVLDFLEAARILSNRDYAFFLIGSGPLSCTVDKYIVGNGLSNKVFAMGHRHDVIDFVSRCDLFALPTYYTEGLPVSVLEAMACAKPVVATKHRGCEDEVIDGVTGYLVESKNPRMLADKIAFLMEDEGLRFKMGNAGRHRVESCFTLEQSMKSFCDQISFVAQHWRSE